MRMLAARGFQEEIRRRTAFICVKQDESAPVSGDLFGFKTMDGVNSPVLSPDFILGVIRCVSRFSFYPFC